MTLKSVAPILPVRDVDAALARYKRLGFDGELYSQRNAEGRPFYGYIWRDGVDIHLSLAPDLDPHANSSAAYLYVDDPDALYAQWSAAGVDGHLRQPEDTPWGMREMSFSDPDGNLLRIGRSLAKSPASAA